MIQSSTTPDPGYQWERDTLTVDTKNESQEVSPFPAGDHKVSKGAKIRNRYNQVQHLTQDTNVKVTNLQLDTTNESQEVSPFPAGNHKACVLKSKYIHLACCVRDFQ